METKVNKARNKEILKDLTKYSKSDEFNTFTEYCDNEVSLLDKEIDKELENRTSIELIGSYITNLQAQIHVLRNMADKCGNAVLKAWMEERIERLKSQIYNDCDNTEKLFLSKVDLIKIQKSQYNAGPRSYLPYCMDLYKDMKEVDYFRQQDPYTF